MPLLHFLGQLYLEITARRSVKELWLTLRAEIVIISIYTSTDTVRWGTAILTIPFITIVAFVFNITVAFSITVASSMNTRWSVYFLELSKEKEGTCGVGQIEIERPLKLHSVFIRSCDYKFLLVVVLHLKIRSSPGLGKTHLPRCNELAGTVCRVSRSNGNI